eukprot:9393003-Prorocentrum_lima.AAC.1
MTSSLVGSEMCIRDRYADPDKEEFLMQPEAEMNPRYWLRRSGCVGFNPYSDTKAVQYDDICQLMHYCCYSNENIIYDD